MEKIVRRRYNFVLKDIPTRKEYLLKNYFGDIKEHGKINYLLSSIDLITLDYENAKELADDIRDILGICVEDPIFYIKYRQNKEERYLKVAYKDMEILRQYAKKSKTKIVEGPEFRKFYRHFMTNIKKERFYNYLIIKHYINERLEKILEEYLYESNIYREKEIYEKLKNYRVIRDYIFGIMEYNKTVKNESAKISLDTIKSKIKEDNSNKTKKIIKKNNKINLSTRDDFLNSLNDRDDIARYYDLDQLTLMDIDETIFDGMGTVGKNLVLKKKK